MLVSSQAKTRPGSSGSAVGAAYVLISPSLPKTCQYPAASAASLPCRTMRAKSVSVCMRYRMPSASSSTGTSRSLPVIANSSSPRYFGTPWLVSRAMRGTDSAHPSPSMPLPCPVL